MSDGDHRQVDVWLDCARLPPGTDYNRIPILAIKVDFTHETGDQEIRCTFALIYTFSGNANLCVFISYPEVLPRETP